MLDDGHIKGIYSSSLEPDASSFLLWAESRLSMEFSLPFPRDVSQSQALGSSSVAKRKQISKHTPPSIPPFLGLLFPVPPLPIKDRNKKRFWSHQAMIYHSFRGVSSNINQHKPLSLPPLAPRERWAWKAQAGFGWVLRQNSLVLSWSEMVSGQLPGFLRFLEDK